MDLEILQKAKDGLQIIDTFITTSRAECNKNFDPKRYMLDDLVYQHKHVVSSSQIFKVEHSKGEEEKIFKVFIDVACRFVSKIDVEEAKAKSKEPKVLAEIQATMVAEYLITNDSLDEDNLNAFALNNASYHVWPFWREYLMSMCGRMNLPKIVVHTFQPAK